MAEFKDILIKELDLLDIKIDEKAIEDLCKYYDLLIQWNEKINLTAITEPKDVALKHFCDSLTILKYIDVPKGSKIIDVGTGAGFPGLVLKIARPDIKLTLLDSLNKRLIFLSDVCEKLELENVETVHMRAEEGSRKEKYREQFDFSVSRAVARLNVLVEYCLPYVRVGGYFIAMKAACVEEEIIQAKAAIKLLSGEIESVNEFELADAGTRAIVAIKKISAIKKDYPRTSAKIKSKPL